MMKSILVWLLATAILISAPAVDAQKPGQVFRIGYLDTSTASGTAVLVEAFRQELSKLGWILGKNLAIEYRFADQKGDRLPELAADLVRLKVDIIGGSHGKRGLSRQECHDNDPHRNDKRWRPCGCWIGC